MPGVRQRGGRERGLSVEGSAAGEAFSLYAERFPCPTLRPGQKSRSFEALVEAGGEALSVVRSLDTCGFFAHCDYGAPPARST